jgi:curved DNA-binding protein CbpA
MRRWTDGRADADLAIITPAPPCEASAEVAEEPQEAIAQPEAIELPAAAIEEEPQPEPEEEPCAIAEPNPFLDADFHGAPNFYEILQISPRADIDTIHRVYRIMAARFHPDNPISGDHEMFLRLCEAYEVLSRPERRMLYDFALQARQAEPNPLFGARIFVDGLDGELNRRFGVLALLYQRRRTNQGSLGISTLELERRMSLPREHLEFTLWYLRSKGFVHVLEENSDFAVTALGVDYVEANSAKNPILRELLTAGSPSSRPEPSASSTYRRARAKSESRRTRRDGSVIIAG